MSICIRIPPGYTPTFSGAILNPRKRCFLEVPNLVGSLRLSYALRQRESRPGVAEGLACRTDLSLNSVRSTLLRRNPLQEQIVKVHAPVKRFDSDALIFSMCTDVVAIILFA